MHLWQPLPESIFALASAEPFSLLFHTARYSSENHLSLLFCQPVRILQAFTLAEIPAIFAQLEEALADGLHVAGYFAYECGYHFEPTAAAIGPNDERSNIALRSAAPLIWLGCYPSPIVFDHAEGRFVSGDLELLRSVSPLPEPVAARQTQTSRHSPRWSITLDAYHRAIACILDKIHAGETYQANFTTSVRFSVADGSRAAIDLYRSLILQQPVAYSAFLHLGDGKILSLSPELFFRRDGERIVTRPMKGTMPRGLDCIEDEAQAQRLREDPKNRAEHVMIVDLLRSDLGRIALTGSVTVEELFTVEHFSTLLQMTSAISARIPDALDYYAIFRALFPSGSVTGAPKVNTMRIIAALEDQPRGVYCGAIGYFSPDRKAVFNVPIRTLEIVDQTATMGVGGGIVADSRADQEFNECLLKANFLQRRAPLFELIETMLWESGVALLELHLARLEASARYFDFPFDKSSLRDRIAVATQSCAPAASYRLRLLLDRNGACRIEAQLYPVTPAYGRVALASETVHSDDLFLRHKTTHRALYDRHREMVASRHLDDFLFFNERDELTEGAISNLFLERDGCLLTPPVSSGLLPGVYRQHLLETRANASEQTLFLDDLRSAEKIYLCNALRGLYPVRLVDVPINANNP